LRDKRLQIYLSAMEEAAVRKAAEQAGMTTSKYGSKLVVDAVLATGKIRDADAIRAVQNFRRLFVESMQLSLQGRLDEQRFKALVEKLAGEP